jgi:uncharacterized cupredoxin-like copper-binding protein
MMQRRILLGVAIAVLAGVLVGAVVGCGYTSSSSAGKTDVRVNLSEFRIDSSVTTFSQGVSYHFVVTNKGEVDHEFMILPPNMGGMSIEQMHSMALMHIDEVAPGQTKTIDYTFRQSASAGNLEMACYLNGHHEAGMKLPITIK